MDECGVRQVSLGNGLFPTEATAKQYGMSVDQLSQAFWSGVNVDDRLQSSGEKIKQMIESGKQVHITNPNGTDLTFGIQSRPVFVSDGVISEEDKAKGGAACMVWLPAGEVYSTPAPGSANGRIALRSRALHGQGSHRRDDRHQERQGHVDDRRRASTRSKTAIRRGWRGG